MKKHLSTRLAVILLGVTACVILLSILFNTVFLKKFYINSKADKMMGYYEMINSSFGNNTIYRNEDVLRIINDGERNNISVIVIDTSLNVKLNSGFSVKGDNLLSRLKDLIFEEDISFGDTIYEDDKYILYSIYDEVTGNNYLELFGSLNSGELLLMRSSINSIEESVDVYNTFSIYSGALLVILSGVVVVFVAFRVAKPIKRLAYISNRMSQLDFTAKYEGDETDEIGSLGKSMNMMFETLEKTITELKQANVELQKDIDKKVEIDEMRKEFISNVSHELKTPITIVSGYAEGLKEAVNDNIDDMNYYCDVIADETKKMNNIVTKLLALNQLEFGENTMELERIDIIQLIEQMLANYKMLFDEKEIKIVFDNSKKVYVWTDEFQISEVISNYISNAINHIGGRKIIFIDVTRLDDKVKVIVKNTGENIPEEDIDKIWIKFYKVDKARTREYGGSGIGLSIVKAIMVALGQDYVVRNTEDGVEFFFTLDCEKLEKNKIKC